MEIYKINYASISDLLFHIITSFSLMPFYSLYLFKGYAYIYEIISESLIIFHYTKTNLEAGIYVFNATNFELKKQSSFPKFTEANQFVIIFKKILNDAILEEFLEEIES